jgi:hypothetical protein
MSRRLRCVAIAGLGAILAAGVAVAVLQPPPSPPKPAPSRPGDRRMAVLQDLDYLRQVPRYDRSFSPPARAAFDAQIDRLQTQAAGLDDAGLEMGASRALALADNGHTNTRGVLLGQGLNAIPVRLAWFSDGLFVVRAKAPELLGARVMAIEGRSPDDLSLALRPYVGGAAALARLYAANIMVSPEALHAAGLAARSDQEALVLQTADGQLARTLAAEARLRPVPGADDHTQARDLSPAPAAGDPPGWRHVLDDKTPPLYLQNPDRHYWRAWPDPQRLYVEIRRVRSQGPQGLDVFLAAVLDEAARRKPRFAVVDLRASPGGDDMLTMAFTKALPRLLPADGRLFILEGPGTFSAGLITAARLKYFAGARAVLIGAPPGDRLRFWAEGGPMVLPNSKIVLRYANGYHDWQTGCGLGSSHRCYWPNYLYAVAAGDLTPQAPIVPSFAAYAAAQDPVMQRVEALERETPK